MASRSGVTQKLPMQASSLPTFTSITQALKLEPGNC